MREINDRIRPSLRRPSARERGFTLIELLLVLAILAVLAAVIVPKFTGRSQQAKVTAARTDISRLKLQLDSFEIDCSRFPTTQEGLQALMQQPADQDSWHGPYVERLKNDPWGNPYIYRCPGQHNPAGYDLFSMGPDGQEGTEDDVDNWSNP